jgi:NAD(P)-dependent dehydrogenase (short-subunit alcohol dehydrogenase family)
MSDGHYHYSVRERNLAGSHVLVVGGSSGIGAAVASRAQTLGGDVTVGGHDADKLAATSHELGGCRTVQLDVGSRVSVERALSGVRPVDHLVITAGQRIVGRLLDQDPDRLLHAVQERIAGAVYVIRACLPHLSAEASITLTSGVLVQRPTADGTAVLAAAVAGVEGLARGLALELAPRRVNVVSPGVTATALLDPVGPDVKARFLAAVASKLPVRRVGTPDDVAAAYLFLMCNDFATGQVLRLDGGGSLV